MNTFATAIPSRRLSKLQLIGLSLVLSASGVSAQTLNSTSLYDLLLPVADSFPEKVTSFSGIIPNTTIMVQVNTTAGVYASPAGPFVIWESSNNDPTATALTNAWSITFTGGLARDLRFHMVDFDSTTTGLREALINLGPELGAPNSLTTSGAENDAQMTYTTDLNGQISHPVQLATTSAGRAFADWTNVNLAAVDFTITRTNSGLGNGFNLFLGEVPTVPEPSSALLLLLGGARILTLRRRAA